MEPLTVIFWVSFALILKGIGYWMMAEATIENVKDYIKEELKSNEND